MLWAAAAEDLSPSCRKGAAFDSLGGELFLYSGKGVVETEKVSKKGMVDVAPKVAWLGDTWLYNIESGSWKMQDPSVVHPAGRWKSDGTVVNNSFVLFGGGLGEDVDSVQQDLWVFEASAGSWRQVQAQNPPRARRSHVVVASASHLHVIGGKIASHAEACNRETWTLPLAALAPGSDGASFAWTQGDDFPGDCRWGGTGTVISDPNGKEFVALFGGRRKSKGPDSVGGYEYFAELWLYDLSAGTWKLAPSSASQPQPRDHHGAARIGQDLWIFGGRVNPEHQESSVLDDVWKFSLSSNTWAQVKHASARKPRPRFMPGVAGREWNGVPTLFVFGGQALPRSTKTGSLNDLWAFSADGGWQEIKANDCVDTPVDSSAVHHGLALPVLAGVGAAAIIVGGVVLWKKRAQARTRPDDFVLLA